MQRPVLIMRIRLLLVLTSLAATLAACSSAQTTASQANSVAAAATTASVTPTEPQATATSHHPPNILFILTDDLNLDEIAVMPKLKSLLIDQGASFSNYFVSVSLCCPSRTTTLRGQYSHNTQVETNGGTNGGFETAHARGVENSTIATWLQSDGYRTALIGKYLNGYPHGVADTYVPPGWNEWDSAAKGNPYSEFNYTLNENGKLVQYGNKPEDYGTDVYAHKASDFITQAAGANNPFFVYLAVYAPHQPATPAPRHADTFPNVQAPRTPSYNEADVSDKPQYIQGAPLMNPRVQQRVDALYRKRLQSLLAVDDAIGGLVDTLKTTGQLDNTYIVFASDNGFHLGQHRLPSGKQTAYEEDIHVPLIVRGPGIAAGTTIPQMVGNIDLAPTFADLAGAQVPDFVDGRSFAPLLRANPPSSDSWRQAYLVEHWQQSNEANLQPTDQTLEPPDMDQEDQTAADEPTTTPPAKGGNRKASPRSIPEFHGLRTSDYTYVEYSTGERELYDLKQDPAELNNIAATADPTLLQRLAERLAMLKTCSAAACRTAEDQPLAR